MTEQNMDEQTTTATSANTEPDNTGGTGAATAESAKASDDSPMKSLKRFVKNHPLLSTIVAVAIILIFGRTFMGIVGTALIIGGLSYLLAVIVYAIFARLSAPKDKDSENSDDHGKADGNAVVDASARGRTPEPLHDLIAAGDEDAKTIGEQYAIMLETADENGGNAELYEAKYSQTMKNVASVIAGKREMEAHPDRFDRVDEISRQYRNTINGVEDHIKSSIRALNTARTEKIREDMDVIDKFNEKEL